ncbi:lipid-A-disaccharide synthase [Pontiella sulfatireligans]|uniref:Lipid-A-disaccharide synthase n=1 Tax=Pontiella sulfatireligans TaxID=2750658 RepID=A0A6C2UQU8_9BACT|nr:lipid-A-disaccharide synthase [Pontiella sulfatireligans]VGO21366.1 Lipid-A-disaccharide synthase [Pontiella sulfatireligans]
MKKSVLVIAGEVSGDLHAAKAVQAVKARSPETVFWGIGGDDLRAEGVELLQHTDQMGVMGIVEVLKQYRFFKQVFQQVLDEVDKREPDAALLVDYPGFNLCLAAELKKRGVKVYYYISPKVWAWNKKRIPKMAQVIDRLMVIFPFEVEVFKDTGLQVDFVGNPLVAQIDDFISREAKPLPWRSERRIALLPGSRKQEIERILPTMLEAAKKLEAQFPGLSFMIATPNARIEKIVNEQIIQCLEKPARLDVICGNAREAMRQAEAAIVTSGTATLETALIGTPHILVYKTSGLTFWLGKKLVKIAHVGLVNIIAGRPVCPEILQDAATPEALAASTAQLMDDTPERKAMLEGYAEVRQLLGAKKAAENVAAILCGDE